MGSVDFYDCPAISKREPIGSQLLLRMTPVDWVNLEGGEAGRRPAAEHPGIIDALDPAIPLDAFAAAVVATDLLITVDMMAARCVGALGHSLWLMVHHSPHWVWGIGRDHTPWYPTARLFRQEAQRNWSDVIDALTRRVDATKALVPGMGRRQTAFID